MGLMDHMINSILIFLSPCLFNLYAENIMQNAGLDEAQAGIKISGGNINNLRYVDDISLMDRRPPGSSANGILQVKKQQLKPDMEQQTGSKSGKEYIKAVYCHLAYLQSIP